MLSLQRLLLSNNDKFFDLLESSAAEASLCAHELTELLSSPPEQRTPDGLIAIRRRNKLVHEDIVALLCASFVTPLEREDIEAVSRRLYRIPKMIEKFSERLLLAQSHIGDETFQRQVELSEAGDRNGAAHGGSTAAPDRSGADWRREQSIAAV